MLYLQQFINKKNAIQEVFGFELYSTPDTKEKADAILDEIEIDLSPENLSCDGELSRSEVQKKLTMLKGAQQELEAIRETL